MKKYAIIVAGGTGSRMKGDIPKQFLLLKGKPVIAYSIDAFYDYDPDLQIILVIHPEYIEFWKQLCIEHEISILCKIIKGGESRFHSVKNGLDSIDTDGFVAIHDAARPMIDAGFIRQMFAEASIFGSAMPGITINDTIRILEGNTSQQLDRTLLRAMQTPQVYRISELKQAYLQAFQTLFTDDASVMQSAGFQLHLCDGRIENIKITHPKDIAFAELMMKV
ncbi:MAG: 2-C-methyl-D-erythritol 4-phosphate cytidylyltransferase [Bacteroidales bacterium]